MQHESTYLKQTEINILFQIHYNKQPPTCVILNPSSSLNELYEKVEDNLFLGNTPRKTIISYQGNPLVSPSNRIIENATFIHDIVAINTSLNSTLSIPKNKRKTVRQFISDNKIYFENQSQFPSFQTLYKIFIVDDLLYKEVQELIEQQSFKAVIRRNIEKFVSCFGGSRSESEGARLKSET